MMTPQYIRNEAENRVKFHMAEYERAVRERIGVSGARMKLLIAMREWEAIA